MHGVKNLPIKRMSDANESLFPTVTSLSQRMPDSYGTADHGQLLLQVSTYGFSQLAVGDQQQMIEEMLSMSDFRGGGIKTPAEADEKDYRIKTFAELFDKLLQSSSYFLPGTCMKILPERVGFLVQAAICSGDQQQLIKNMLHDGSYSRGDAPLKHVGYNNTMLRMELKFRNLSGTF